MGMVGMGSQATDVMIWKATTAHSSVMVGEGAAGISYQMIINAPFTGFAFDMPTYHEKDSSGKLSVFRWAGDCEKTVAGKALYEKVFEKVVAAVPDWDSDRLFLTDIAIIDLGVAEHKTFPDIPLDVTLSEWVEISKDFCSPKSRQFVNSLMDKIIKEII